MNLKFTYIWLLLMGIACEAPPPSNHVQEKPINLRFNEKISLTGVYSKSILSKRGEGQHQGHYKIVVNDSLEAILLPAYQEEALRPPEEVARYEGKKVTVTGILSEKTSLSKPSLQSPPLSVSIPCFISIEDIRMAEE